MLILFALMLQAAPAAQAERFSILIEQPGSCVDKPGDADIVVCGGVERARLAPGVRTVPDSATIADGGGGRGVAQCAARLGGCPSLVGPNLPQIIAGVRAVAGWIKDATAPRIDKSNRVPIPLDDPAPSAR